MKKVRSLAKAILRVVNPEDGFTVPLTEATTRRYVVAKTDNSEGLSGIAELRKEALALAREGYDPTIGGWKDSRTGIFYLDVGTTFASRAVALFKAREWGQKAIYDLEEMREIRVS